MESFFDELRKNSTNFYFFIIFSVLWGSGMLWGIIFVLSHLGRRGRTVKALRAMHLEPANKNPYFMERIRDLCLTTVYRDLGAWVDAKPREDLLSATMDKHSIRLTYATDEEVPRLPRATGLRGKIRITKRVLTLKRLLYRATGPEAFYAETIDAETVKAFQPRTRVRSSSGWLLCFAGPTRYQARTIVQRKFTGSARILMSLAYRITQVQPAEVPGLLPDFEREFDATPYGAAPLDPAFDAHTQNEILAAVDAFHEGLKLTLDPQGIWVAGSEWPGGPAIKRLATLCETLMRT